MYKKMMVLAFVAVPMMQAAVTTNDVLLGVGTGFLARGTSYALKKQGGTNNQQAMIGAAVAVALATVATQGQVQGGGFNKGVAQVAIAFATFVTTMYIFPTLGDEDDAIAVGDYPAKKCTGNCKHAH